MPDLENQLPIDGAEFVEVEATDPLLPKTDHGSSPKSSRYFRRVQEKIELDDIPPIIKSANGNIFWADELCTRRVGLTSTEARLFLRLLQVDEPENLNYEDYKNMFDDFGKEQKQLQKLVAALPWWSVETYRQKAIWEARIQWLDRMKEPRLWLLYLMARRRRILKQATYRVLGRLREKSERRKMNGGPHVHPEQPQIDQVTEPKPPVGPMMVNDASQTSEIHLSTTKSPTSPVMVNDASQTPETHLSTTKTATTIAALIRSSFSTGHRDSRSHSRPSTGHCPVFDKPFEATREDIKKQVELLMPKPSPYIVIGWFLRSASDPKERILEFNKEKELFKVLRYGESDVRGWRRFFSLKSLKGFGLYKCDIARGAHIPLALTTSQKAIMSQFFLAYKASYRHSDDTVAVAWQGWVNKNLNDCKNNPLEGRYSVQLIYDWSSYRLSIIVAVPLLLSLALGFWYMQTTGDVVTAWTISLYIITAAAAVIALLAIIGSLKDI